MGVGCLAEKRFGIAHQNHYNRRRVRHHVVQRLDFRSGTRWLKGIEDVKPEASYVSGVACYQYQVMYARGRSQKRVHHGHRANGRDPSPAFHHGSVNTQYARPKRLHNCLQPHFKRARLVRISDPNSFDALFRSHQW
jgi:hypothetical protein